MSFIYKVVAKNPPSILFVAYVFLLLLGSTAPDMSLRESLFNSANTCFVFGVVLQVAYLFSPRRK